MTTPDDRELVRELVVVEYLEPMMREIRRKEAADALVCVVNQIDPGVSFSLSGAFQTLKQFSELLLLSRHAPTSSSSSWPTPMEHDLERQRRRRRRGWSLSFDALSLHTTHLLAPVFPPSLSDD